MFGVFGLGPQEIALLVVAGLPGRLRGRLCLSIDPGDWYSDSVTERSDASTRRCCPAPLKRLHTSLA